MHILLFDYIQAEIEYQFDYKKLSFQIFLSLQLDCQVYNVEDLIKCNTSYTSTISLNADLDFNYQQFPLIKINYKFQGNNHTIMNINNNQSYQVQESITYNVTDPETLEIDQLTNTTDYLHNSLFYALNNSAIVENLILKNIYISTEPEEEMETYIGLLFSQVNSTKLNNIKTQNITLDIKGFGNVTAGGLIAYNKGTNYVLNSNININIINQNFTMNNCGGIIGTSDGRITMNNNYNNLQFINNGYVRNLGGIIGETNSLSDFNYCNSQISTSGINDDYIFYQRVAGIIANANNYKTNFSYIENTIDISWYQNQEFQDVKVAAFIYDGYTYSYYQNILTHWKTLNIINVVGSDLLMKQQNTYLDSENLYKVVTYQQCQNEIQLCKGINIINDIYKIQGDIICNAENINQTCKENAICQEVKQFDLINYYCKCLNNSEDKQIIYQNGQCIIYVEEIVETDNTDYLELLRKYENRAKYNKNLQTVMFIMIGLTLIAIVAATTYFIMLRKYINKQNIKIINSTLSNTTNNIQQEELYNKEAIINTNALQQPPVNKTVVKHRHKIVTKIQKSNDKVEQLENNVDRVLQTTIFDDAQRTQIQ